MRYRTHKEPGAGSMSLRPYFSSSAKVWDDIRWVYGIEEAGYAGRRSSQMATTGSEQPENLKKIQEVLASTRLGATVHAPYGDLNLATLNDPIWRESIRQIELLHPAGGRHHRQGYYSSRVSFTVHANLCLRKSGTSRKRLCAGSGSVRLSTECLPALKT